MCIRDRVADEVELQRRLEDYGLQFHLIRYLHALLQGQHVAFGQKVGDVYKRQVLPITIQCVENCAGDSNTQNCTRRLKCAANNNPSRRISGL